MLLTRIWAVLLAILATGCLAGMFLLSAGNSGDFTEADRDAVRAVTEAGVVALSAGINASEVQQVSTLVIHEPLREALVRQKAHAKAADGEESPGDEPELPQVLAEATEALRLKTGTNLTVAVVDGTGRVIASNGISESSMPEVIATEAYRAIPPTDEGTFSITIDSEIHVAKVTPTVIDDRRLVAIDRLNLGAGSLLRRVLGSDTPAGIVRDGTLVGEIFGDQPISDEIEALAKEHVADVPEDGASTVFTMGGGLDKRIGALGRVPGPAGRGTNGAMLVVMSRQSAAASQQDIAAAISEARRKGVRVNWPILVGLLLVSAALAIYLPYLEAIGPMNRLSHEFNALALGQQHQVFHDRYGGVPGRTARSAAAAYEALRQAFLAELEIEDDGIEHQEEEELPRRPRTSRRRRLTRAHQKLGEGHEQSTGRANTGSRKRPRTGAQQESPRPTPATPASPVSPAPVSPAPVAPAPTPAPAPFPTPAPAAAPSPPPPGPSAVPVPAPAPIPTPITAPAPVARPAPAAAPPEDEFEELFEEFVQVKQACGEPTDNLTYDRFAAKLRKNERDLKAKRPDIKRVQFTVYVKDGKAALKAKVIK